MGFPGQKQCVTTFLLLGKRTDLMYFLRRETEHKERKYRFPQTTCYHHFVVIHLNCKHNCMLRPMRPSSKSLNIRMVLRTLTHLKLEISQMPINKRMLMQLYYTCPIFMLSMKMNEFN